MENIGLNVPVLLFALVVSMLVGILFGLAPALKASTVDLQSALKSRGRGSMGGHHGSQATLAVFQIALALVLLTGGSLLFRTIHNLWTVNPGFHANHVISFQVGLSPAFTVSAPATRVAYQQLVERLGQIPGIDAADFTALLPFSENSNSGPFWVGSQQPASMAQIPRATIIGPARITSVLSKYRSCAAVSYLAPTLFSLKKSSPSMTSSLKSTSVIETPSVKRSRSLIGAKPGWWAWWGMSNIRTSTVQLRYTINRRSMALSINCPISGFPHFAAI